MPVTARDLVEFVLLGPTNDRRQLQDSPVLGDVWMAFATEPTKPHDLLMSPYKGRAAGPVAVMIARRVNELGMPRSMGQAPHVAYLQGLVAARLFFRELLQVVVPLTGWWHDQKIEDDLHTYTGEITGTRIEAILGWARARDTRAKAKYADEFAKYSALDRYMALAGLILWAGRSPRGRKGASSDKDIGAAISSLKSPKPVVDTLIDEFTMIIDWKPKNPPAPQVWQVSLNRKVMAALERSVPAVKGDAARTVFKVQCSGIAWAVIDSGIDATHKAFIRKDGTSRIVKTLDFSNIRKIVSLDNIDPKARGFEERLAELMATPRATPMTKAQATRLLTALAQDADNDRPINWGRVEDLIELDPATPPPASHGTHVAGILGADGGYEEGHPDGMCPDIQLYDLRVVGTGSSLEDTEFAIVAALQYVRHLNESRSFMSVHGVNLSLSIPHDVRNFACGRTPVCNECERLVESGVVVVAAAGNLGFQSFQTHEGSFDSYAAFSITDPGNADSVLTVGATHRSWPHTYGVSFFSSRGPTGDGRMKPDLVAPGERINSTVPGGWKDLDGTSMAAPHVSGAAAMLMARYPELVNQPRRIKAILCETATDLGRERNFQGHGMLDVLRAFQKI